MDDTSPKQLCMSLRRAVLIAWLTALKVGHRYTHNISFEWSLESVPRCAWECLWTDATRQCTWYTLTHWGRVTHICVGQLITIVSYNGLSPHRRQAIIWNNDQILLVGPVGRNFSEILIEIYTFSFKKMHLKMSSGKWRPSCLDLNVLIHSEGKYACLVEHMRRSVVPKPGIKGSNKWLHPTVSVGCNYLPLPLPLIPASGTALLLWRKVRYCIVLCSWKISRQSNRKLHPADIQMDLVKDQTLNREGDASAKVYAYMI